MNIVNIIQDFNTGGIQKLLMEYLRFFKDSTEHTYQVVVLEKNRSSSFDQAAAAEGLNVVYLNCVPSKNDHYYIRKASDFLNYNGRLFLWLLKNKPDVVHTHNTRIFKKIQWCMKGLRWRFPWFHTLHSDPYAVHESHIPVAKKMFQGVVRPICLNETQFQKARQRYGLEQCRLLFNCLDCTRFLNSEDSRESILELLQLPSGKFIMGSVGRLEKVKNYGFLLEVFAQVRGKKENAILILCGDGSEREFLQKKADELGVRDDVYFLGNRSDVEKVYRVIDVFLATSLTEASSFAVIEAQVAGCVCIVSEAIPEETVISSKVVRMKANTSAQEWGEAVCAPGGFAAVRATLEDYLLETNARKMLEIYGEAMRK